MPAGSWSGRALAANAISAMLILLVGPCTMPASMRVAAADFFGERAARPAHRAAGKHDGARREGAKTIRADRGVAVAHRNLAGIDAELVGGDLRQRSLVTLAVVLHADEQQNAAIRQHADV